MHTRDELLSINNVALALEPHAAEARQRIVLAALTLLDGTKDSASVKFKEMLLDTIVPLLVSKALDAVDQVLHPAAPTPPIAKVNVAEVLQQLFDRLHAADVKSGVAGTDPAQTLYDAVTNASEKAENDLKTGASDTAETDGALAGSDPNASH